ncbi:MAG TPA: metalloregulator ArsR/SmtB family transcription factor [Gemmatimonadaceae bacterium]|nr:metalloregulator ArsR/SmtB family transcription factor [Gemmatimonadaceae bacterium]
MPRRPAHATVYQAIADPTRRAMLELLGTGERSAGELGAPTRLTQPAVSQHLRVLREAGLVTQRKVGRHRIYALQAAPLAGVADWVRYFEQFWDRRLTRLGSFLDRSTRQ